MRTMLIAMIMHISMIAFAATPTITGVTAQQRYPWNGKVDISYTVTGDIAAEAKQRALITSLKVTANDNVANKTYTATKVSGNMALTAGTHKFVWDLDAEGLTFKSSNVVFTVSCETTPALYCVIDLSAGSSASSYPVTYLAEPPSGGFNVNEYKTTKLALRKVTKGSNSAGGSMSKDMWVGIFEVTEQQYVQVKGSVSFYYNYQGYSSGYELGSNPTRAAGGTERRCEGFLSTLKSRSGINMRLPTGLEWQYACRAGTPTDYNNGLPATQSNLDSIGWSCENIGTNGGPAVVGQKSPNLWGLYDMHGNLAERVSDTYYNNNLQLCRYYYGGSYASYYYQCTSSSKDSDEYGGNWNGPTRWGFRVFADVE